MPTSFDSARRHQIAFAVLLAVCVAQVGWWMLDQWMFSAEVKGRLEQTHRRNLDAARLMLSRGVTPAEIADMFPELSVSDDGALLGIDPAVVEALEADRYSRLNRYAWEGGFFLLVLSAAIAVLWRAVRTEVRLRRRQHNFVTAVTHELKSPLASVRLSAETLEYRDADRETRARLVGRLIGSLDRVDATVANILDTARIDEGKVSLAPEAVALAPAVRDVAASLEATAHSNGVAVDVEIDEQVSVYADARALATVLHNLIANGIAACAGADDARVAVTGAATETSVAIEVRDNGRGFDPGAGEKLFERFYRPGDEIRREGRGTGLGLYIARSLVVAAGGTLSAHSEGPGRGALFRAVWPTSPTDAAVPR